MRPLKRKRQNLPAIILSLVTAVLCLLYVFPLFYMFITSFKPETQTVPPQFFFTPTLENYEIVLSSDILPHLLNSLVLAISTIVACLALGVPAAYAIVFGRLKSSRSISFWFLSTLFLPAVSVIIPIFLIFRVLGLLDTHLGLLLVYTGMNVPIVVWMTSSFFRDIPVELLESSMIDGASRFRSFFSIMLPLVRSGIVSTALLVFIFTWNEFFFAVNFTYINASTLPVYMASFMTQEGFFWAKLSAIATVTVLPPLVLGWVSHKSLVRGLISGAVKG